MINNNFNQNFIILKNNYEFGNKYLLNLILIYFKS